MPPVTHPPAAAQARGMLCPVQKMRDANEVLAQLFTG